MCDSNKHVHGMDNFKHPIPLSEMNLQYCQDMETKTLSLYFIQHTSSTNNKAVLNDVLINPLKTKRICFI
jgi:hypothetical protein